MRPPRHCQYFEILRNQITALDRQNIVWFQYTHLCKYSAFLLWLTGKDGCTKVLTNKLINHTSICLCKQYQPAFGFFTDSQRRGISTEIASDLISRYIAWSLIISIFLVLRFIWITHYKFSYFMLRHDLQHV